MTSGSSHPCVGTTLVLRRGRVAVSLTTVAPDARGRFTASVLVPRTTGPGLHTIDARTSAATSVLVRPLSLLVRAAPRRR